MPRFDLDALGEAATVRPPPLPGELRLDAQLLRAADVPSVAIEDLGKLESSVSGELDTGGMGFSWEFIRSGAELSQGQHLRAVVETLQALSALHTDVAKRPNQRFHGAICWENVLFRRDGRALLVRTGHSMLPQPATYEAPEVGLRHADQQVDIYAVGVMSMEALTQQTLGAAELRGLTSVDVARHPFWSRFAADPSFGVALRALDSDPSRRWRTAREFAEELWQSAQGRVCRLDEFAQLIADALRRPSKRATPLSGLERSRESSSAEPVMSGLRYLADPAHRSEPELARAVGAEEDEPGGLMRRHRRRTWGQP